MSRAWSKANEKDLARFVDQSFARWVSLDGVNRSDLVGRPEGRAQLIEAIYADLLTRGIRYTPEEYDQDERKQLVRTPAEILDAPKEGTCLDLSLLFAGVCLGKDLLPLVIVTDRHAFVAVSLRHTRREWSARDRHEFHDFKDAPVTDIKAVHDLVAGGGYLAVECTGFAESTSLLDDEAIPEGKGRGVGAPPGLMSFERAVAAGTEQLEQADRVRFVLDVAIAHDLWGIEPFQTDGATTMSVETVREAAEAVIDLTDAGRRS